MVQKDESDIHGFFLLAIGHHPNSEIFSKWGKDNEEGSYYLPMSKAAGQMFPAVFAAGDVQDNTYRLAITAAGSGCMAALVCGNASCLEIQII
jgi:thioredoxin reductase (NADPH)